MYRRISDDGTPDVSRPSGVCTRKLLSLSVCTLTMYTGQKKTSLHTSLSHHTAALFLNTGRCTRAFVLTTHLLATVVGCWFTHFSSALPPHTLLSVYGQSKPGGLLFRFFALSTLRRRGTLLGFFCVIFKITHSDCTGVHRIHTNTDTLGTRAGVIRTRLSHAACMQGCAKTCFRLGLPSATFPQLGDCFGNLHSATNTQTRKPGDGASSGWTSISGRRRRGGCCC